MFLQSPHGGSKFSAWTTMNADVVKHNNTATVFGQWVLDSRAHNRKTPTAVSAETVTWHGKLMTAGRTQTLSEKKNQVRRSLLAVAVLSRSRGWENGEGTALPPVLRLPMIFCNNNANIWFLCVSNFKKSGHICGSHWTSKNQKCLSFRGLRPTDPWPEALPLNLAGGFAFRSRYRLVLRRSPWGRASRYCTLEPPLLARSAVVGTSAYAVCT